METLIIIRDTNGVVPYWSSGYNLKEARANYKKHSGKFPSKNAIYRVYRGTREDLDKIEINDLGDIIYPKKVTQIVL